jgi:hypothetical protein
MTDLTAERIAELRALWEPIGAAAAKELKLGTMPDLLDCPDDMSKTKSGAHRLAHLVVQWEAERTRADRLAGALEGLLSAVDAHNEANGREMIDPHAVIEARAELVAGQEQKL